LKTLSNSADAKESTKESTTSVTDDLNQQNEAKNLSKSDTFAITKEDIKNPESA